MGDIKDVSDGYGRNFLLPQKLAKVASEKNSEEAASLKKKAESQEKIMKEKAETIAKNAVNAVLEFSKKPSTTGTLFASLTKEEVAEKLSETVGGKIEPEMIDFKEHGEHIKHEGEHMVTVKLTAINIKPVTSILLSPLIHRCCREVQTL